MKTTTINFEFCEECPNYNRSRDELSYYCSEGVNLHLAIHNKFGQLIIPNECPLRSYNEIIR